MNAADLARAALEMVQRPTQQRQPAEPSIEELAERAAILLEVLPDDDPFRLEIEALLTL